MPHTDPRPSLPAQSPGLSALSGPHQLRVERDAALQAARDALADMTRLTRLLTILGEPGSEEQLLDRAVSSLSELFFADLVMVLTPAGQNTCSILAAVGLPETMLDEPVACSPQSKLAMVLSAEQSTVSESLSEDPNADWRFRELGIEAALWVPMRDSQAAVVGVIALGRCAPEPFPTADVNLLVSMGHRLGLAVEQAQRAVQLERLAHSAQAVARELEEAAILHEAVRMVPDVLRADAAIIFLVDQRKAVRAYAQSGLTDAEIEAWREHVDNLTSATVLTTGQPYQTSDLRADPNRLYEWPAVWRIRSLLAVPITWGGRVQGAVLACRFTANAFAPDAVQLATLYANQVAPALENARLLDRFRALVRSVADVIAIVDEDGTFRYVSPAAHSAWGCAPNELTNLGFLERVHPEDRVEGDQLLLSVQGTPGAIVTGSLRLRHAADAWRDFEVILSNQLGDPAVDGIVVTSHDVTERKAFEAQLSNLAFRDPLSGLPNRVLFLDRLEQALIRANRTGACVAVMFVDLDSFKVVNDSLGHAAGDAVLIEIAERLTECIRAEDTAARLGGDEFTVLIEEVIDPALAITIADRIQQALGRPIRLANQDVFVSASIGIALSTPDSVPSEKPDDLVRKADLAMYRAKSSGKAQYALFEADLTATALERLELETDLRLALERGELRVHYQPIVSLENQHILGVEALVRWAHSCRGLIGPDLFIPLAEETGLIVPIGQWVLEQACQQVRRWQTAQDGCAQLALNVNLSARQFSHQTLVEDIARALQSSGLDPADLTLEITETAVMRNLDDAVEKLRALKATGISVAIDDFGTGYASLSAVMQFPIDTLKIDRSFVNGLDHDADHVAVVRSIITLAQGLGLGVTAEGIETAGQSERLRSLGCHQGQGYFFARPMPPEQFTEVFVTDSPRRAGRAA